MEKYDDSKNIDVGSILANIPPDAQAIVTEMMADIKGKSGMEAVGVVMKYGQRLKSEASIPKETQQAIYEALKGNIPEPLQGVFAGAFK